MSRPDADSAFPPRPLITQCARFSAADRDLLAERCHPHTRIGLAYQIAFVRPAGQLPRQKPFEVALELLRYVAERLGLQADLVERYAERQPTVSRHADLAANHLGDPPFTGDEVFQLIGVDRNLKVSHRSGLLWVNLLGTNSNIADGGGFFRLAHFTAG